jgi:hypothetical protein
MQHDAWAHTLAEMGDGDDDWTCWFAGRSRDAYLGLVRRTIVGDCDPRHVVLVDIDPPNQKTVCDFSATKKLFGVDALDPRGLLVRGTSCGARTTRAVKSRSNESTTARFSMSSNIVG